MKKKIFVVILVLALLCIPFMAACTPATEDAAPAAEEDAAPAAEEEASAAGEDAASVTESYYFVFVPKLIHPWYDDVEKGAATAIAELAELGVEVTYDWDAPNDADVVMQTQRLESAIAKEPDVLFVSCLDVDANKPLIQEAVDAGIPVISYDTPCTGTAAMSFVGRYDYEEDGADLAEVLAEAIGYEGEVAILAGSPGALNHKQRVDGFKKAMEAYPDITIVAEEFDNDDVERAANLTASILQANPDLKGVFGCNAANPVGAGRAIVEAGKKGEVMLVGMDDQPDMVQFVKDGTALAMSVQNVSEIGYWGIHDAVRYLQGHTIPKIHDTGSAVVFADRADTYKASVSTEDKEKYFVFVPKLIHPWYDDVEKGAADAMAELAKLGYDITYDWDAPNDADVVMQTQRLESAIAKEPDVLFVSCLDVDANKPLIQEAVDAGIPVISFDTPCTGTAAMSFVGRYDYVEDGLDIGEALAEAIGYEGEVAILAGSPGALNHKQRVEGFKQAMAQYPDITIVAEEFDNDDVERAANLTASILQANPDLKGIFGCNAANPVGAGRAIVEAGKKGEVMLVGMDDQPDMVQFVKDGTALAMSVQNVSEIGYWGIHYAVALDNGHTYAKIHDTGSAVIFADGVDTYKD